MPIAYLHDTESRIFKAMDGELQAGYLTYIPMGEHIMAIDHTVVKPSYQGQGIAKELVMQAVAYARGHQIKIKPVCSYAVAVFARNPTLKDVQA